MTVGLLARDDAEIDLARGQDDVARMKQFRFRSTSTKVGRSITRVRPEAL